MSRLVIVSNRVPPARDRAQLAGGLAIGLKEAISTHQTLWFGWSGNASKEPRPHPKTHRAGRVTYATLDLGDRDYRGYYRGFSNGMLWPLLHYRVGLSDFNRDELAAYIRVNDLFAEGLSPLIRPDDLIWVHDYHLIPLGAALRRLGVTNRIGFFLHVPFPPRQLYAALPQGAKLLQDFAAYDVIGLQTQDDAENLTDAMQAEGINKRAQAFPIGIDPEGFAKLARDEEPGEETTRLKASLGDRALILGVDRLDYSKGIPERFRGYAELLRNFPDQHNKVTMLQVAPVSRGDVTQYRALRRELDELTGRINGQHAEFDWTPLRWITQTVPRATLAGFQRIARIGLVTPLRDGMNLVAKEFVAAQNEADPGALVLSRFAGAAQDMKGAILVNPHDPTETAEAINQGLTMSLDERRSRFASMWEATKKFSAANWAINFITALDQ